VSSTFSLTQQQTLKSQIPINPHHNNIATMPGEETLAAIATTTTGTGTPTTLLPSMLFGREFSTLPSGKKTYMTTTGKLVCEHGEYASTICHWLMVEKRARFEKTLVPPRGGDRGRTSCDCAHTEGLNCKPSVLVKPPSPPESLFGFLQASGTEMVVVKGHEAHRVPHLAGPTFVMATGRFCCRHGASRQSLIDKQKATKPSRRRPICGCKLELRPRRADAFKGVRIGLYASNKPVLCEMAEAAEATEATEGD
jgi:hypothetical protein